jgi:YD repeat-containing protein
MSELLQSGRAGEVIKTEKFMDQTPIGVKHVKYKLEDSMYVPHIIETSTTDYSALEDEVIYDEYDAEGNVVQYHKANDLNNVIVWGYDNRFPVVNIANAVFTEVESDPAYSWIQNITDKQSLLNQFDNLRTNLSSAMMTAYTYDNHGGITSITSPTGQTQHFEYDDFNRLQLTRDLDGNILVKNGYRYTDEKYFAMSDILGVRTNLEQGELNMFSVAVVGGSGQYNYDWRFYNEGNLIHTSNSSFVNKVMDYAGITTIICEVTDQTTNERVSTSSENIYVTEVPYEFSSINNINKGVEAYLESPIAGDVTFTLLNQATSANSTYYIGSQVYTPGYGSQDVTVSFNGQTKVYVKIEIPDGLSGAFAQLEIKSHSHNGAIIGTQKIISVSIQ